MDTLSGADVLDFNDPAAPLADRVDGVYAKAAIANEPRHHELSHRTFPIPLQSTAERHEF